MTEDQDGSGEDRLIARHFAPLARAPGAFGLTDDAASLTPPEGCDLVLTTDAIVGGVHFFPDDPPASVAHKALRVNLSDLAAKGARPLGFLLTLALPPRIGDDWLAAFAGALGEDADAYACPLLGGDTVASPDAVMVSVSAFGAVPRGTMVRRGGARPGDRIVVTGTIGDAALGLLVSRDAPTAARWGLDAAMLAHLVSRYQVPQPRNRIAELVRTQASAAMDVSDGLVGDLAKLCAASGVTARIAAARVPLSAAAARAVATAPELLRTALTGGDDFEIVATVPADRVAGFIATAVAAGVPAAEIGEIVVGSGVPHVFGPDGRPLQLGRMSFSHF